MYENNNSKRPVTNSISLSGVVTSENPEFNHEVYGEKFYKITVTSLRNSGTPDNLNVIISERLVDVSELKPETPVEITGDIRTFNKHLNKDSTRPRLIVSVFAKDIKVYQPDEDVIPDTNNVYLDGYLCKAPNYRETLQGREICDCLIAVNRAYGKSDYIPAIVWGRNAKFTGGLEAGNHIQVHGRLQSRVYTKRLSETEIEERIAYEVSVSKIDLVD